MMDQSPGGARTLFAGGGRIHAFNNIGAAPALVVNPRGDRKTITFHNPGANDIIVAPLVIQNSGSAPLVSSTDVPLVPSAGALGGCWRVYSNGGQLVIEGAAAQIGWQAFALTGAANPLSVMDSNS